MIYSRPGGMSQSERAKTLRRLAGGTLPNASGATSQESPQALAASGVPSSPLKLTPEQEATAEANRLARDEERQKNLDTLKAADLAKQHNPNVPQPPSPVAPSTPPSPPPPQPQHNPNTPPPVTPPGELDGEEMQVHEAAVNDRATDSLLD